MFIRPVPVVLAFVLLSGAFSAAAQRTDILTGEPARPRSAHPGPSPEILNAPHAPRQTPGSAGGTPPLEIYVAPQIGATGRPLPGRPVQQRPY